jgi:hypothetical protein
MENKLYEVKLCMPNIIRTVSASSKEEAEALGKEFNIRNIEFDDILNFAVGAEDISDDGYIWDKSITGIVDATKTLKVFEARVDLYPCTIEVVAEDEADAKKIIWDLDYSEIGERFEFDNYEIDDVECTSTDASGYERGLI